MHTSVAKADEIVSKFFGQVSNASDSDWLTVRNQAGELLQKRAELLHPTLNGPDAMAKVATQPDEVSKALYAVQAIKSQEHFAAYKSVLRSGGQ